MKKNNIKQINLIAIGLGIIGFTLGICLDCVELIFVTISVTAVAKILGIVIIRPKTIGGVILTLIDFIIGWMFMFGFYFICKGEVIKAILVLNNHIKSPQKLYHKKSRIVILFYCN